MSSEAAGNLPRAQLLLGEDETMLRELVVEILEGAGHGVDDFESGGDLLSAFRRDPEHYDLTILDWDLPDCSGRELLAALRAVRPEMPILLTTGGESGEASLLASEEGPLHFLRKPYKTYELLGLVAAMLAEHPRSS